MKHKWKVFLILGIEFVAILLMLIVVFFAGKKSYTVTFDLNGGTLLHGDLVQRVTQGQSATPPATTKDGCFFLEWRGSYKQVTKDVTIKAIWEYETTEGIIYSENVEGEDSTYCEIIGCYKELAGDVYIGAYHNDKKVLGIKKGAFAGCENITSIHLLDGILAIEDGAFAGCTSLESIELPSSLISLGARAFEGCTSLETIEMPATLKKIGNAAFQDCTTLSEISFEDEAVLKTLGADVFRNCTALQNVLLPDSLEEIGSGAFVGCSSLKTILLPLNLTKMGSGVFDQEGMTVITYFLPENRPAGWAENWCLKTPNIEWGYTKPAEPEIEEPNEQEEK